MAASTVFRLPGVDFQPARAKQGIDLPPLDVAGFVGFATRGPVGLAVPVDDLAGFDSLFGGPLAVARDASGQAVNACLRDAVAAFFTAGGRRCHAVRVVGPDAAAAVMTLPGMITVDADGDPARARIEASSPGAWGSGLRIGTILSVTPLPPARFTPGSNGRSLAWVSLGAPLAVQAGDLLRLTFDDDATRAWLFAVAPLQPGVADTPLVPLSANGLWSVQGSAAIAAGVPEVIGVTRLALPLESDQPLDIQARFINDNTTAITLSIDGPDSDSVSRNDVLLLALADGSRHVINVADVQARRVAASLPATETWLTATDMVCLQPAGNAPAMLPDGARLLRIERLQLNLRVKLGDDVVREIDSLGFNAGHPRYWPDIAVGESWPSAAGATASQSAAATLQPGDATRLYADLFGSARVDIDWTDTRLPTVLGSLFAPANPAAGTTTPTVLPVGMALLGNDADLVGPTVAGSDDLGTFSASLFLDPTLLAVLGGDPSTAALMAAATDLYYLQDQRLLGLHALLFDGEVALVGVPDAVQVGWVARDAAVAGPSGTPAMPTASAGTTAGFDECEPLPSLDVVDPASGPLDGSTFVNLNGTGFQGVTSISFGAWPAAIVSVAPTTIVCIAPPAAFAGAVDVSVATDTATSTLASAYAYEPASTAPPLPVSLMPADYDVSTLQAIHAAMLCVCEARGDAIAILSLPQSFEKQDCLAWLQGLRAALGLPRHGSVYADATDVADLSYAAVYHPWLLIADASGATGGLRAMPPEGAVCGAIAAREIARQVWVAPANVPLPGVLDLQPAFNDDDWAALFEVGINLVRQEARDFRIMSACTLADLQSLRELSVRRLLIQLRKAMLTRSQDDVFEGNDDRLRQRIRNRLEDLLRYMFAREAFAGPTQQSSYQIAVDDSVNTRSDLDQGRLIAQVLVAPSQPMEFISVSLNRTGTGVLQATEA